MSHSVEVIPAIIPHSLEELKGKLVRLRRGEVRMIQIDLTDGMMVVNRSWPFNPGDKASFQRIVSGEEGLPYWEEFNFEVDLMVQNPEKILPDWVKAGISRAVIHLKSRHDMGAVRDALKDAVELGVAVSTDTPYEKIEEAVRYADYLQVMGIKTIGKQGEAFNEAVFPLLKKIKSDFPDVILQVDGGVSDEVADDLIQCGVSRLVSGSFILTAEDPHEAVQVLKGNTL